MKMPNGYGSVIKLSGRRRRPYAVRITLECTQTVPGRFCQKYKYLGYFEKRKDACIFLAKYNSTAKADTTASSSPTPTFEDVYNMWIQFKCSLNKKPSSSTFRNYGVAFRQLSALHQKEFKNIRLKDLQDIVFQYRNKSASTNRMIMTVLHGIYEYAIKYELIEKDYSQLITVEWTDSSENVHIPFSKAEINQLWTCKDEPNVYIILILIYSGMRASEFLTLETKNIFLEKRYIRAGIKTAAGRNRMIPIHEKLIPLFKSHYNEYNKYFYPNSNGNAYYFDAFNNTAWKKLMKKLGMSHKPHDTRHTCATLLESAGINDFHRKLILGHSINDLTNRIYTHVSIEDLISDINKI